MGILVEFAGSFLEVLGSLKDHLKKTIDGFIDIGLGDFAFFDGRDDFRVGLTAGSWHFEVARSLKSGNAIVIATPVGDDDAVIAPLIS